MVDEKYEKCNTNRLTCSLFSCTSNAICIYEQPSKKNQRNSNPFAIYTA